MMAHTADQLLQFSAESLGRVFTKNIRSRGHFAKHVGLYASVPQTTIGFLVTFSELATRNKGTDLKLSLGREIAHNTSNLLANLGLAKLNPRRALLPFAVYRRKPRAGKRKASIA